MNVQEKGGENCSSNIIPSGSRRPSVTAVKALSRSNRAQSETTCARLPTDAEKEVKRLHVTIKEKDKQLRALELALSQKDMKIEEYIHQENRYKNIEREYKRTLSSKSTTDRRYDTLLRQTRSSVDKIAQKEAEKLRRKQLEHQELQEELERIEEASERSIEELTKALSREQEISSCLTNEKEEAVAAIRTQLEAVMAENHELSEQLNQVTIAYEKLEEDLSITEKERDDMISALRISEDKNRDDKDLYLCEITTMSRNHCTQLDAIRQEVAEGDGKYRDCLADYQAANEKCQALNEQLVAVQQQLTQVQEESVVLLCHRDDTITQLRTEFNQLHNDYQTKVTELTEVTGQAEQHRMESEMALSTLREELSGHITEITQLQQVNATMTENLLGIETTSCAQRVELEELQNSRVAWLAQKELLEATIVDLRQSSDSLELQLAKSQSDVMSGNQTCENLASVVSTLQEEICALKLTLATAQQEVIDLEKARGQLQSLNTQVLLKMAGLEESLGEHKAQIVRLKDDMLRVRQEKNNVESDKEQMLQVLRREIVAKEGTWQEHVATLTAEFSAQKHQLDADLLAQTARHDLLTESHRELSVALEKEHTHVARLQSDLEEKVKRIDALESEKAQLVEDKQVLVSELEQRVTEVNDLRVEGEKLVADRLALQSEMAAQKCEFDADLQRITTEKALLVEDLHKSKHECEKVTEALHKAESDMETLSVKEATASNLLKTNEGKYMKRAVASAALRNQLDAAEATIAEQEKQMGSLKAMNATLLQDIKKMELAVETSTTNQSIAQQQSDKIVVELSSVKECKARLERDVQRLTHDLDAANSKISDVFTDKSELGAKLNAALDKVSTLSNSLGIVSAELTAVQCAHGESKVQLQQKIELIGELQKQLKGYEDDMAILQSENYRHLKSALELKESVVALKAQVTDLQDAKHKVSIG